MFFFYIFRSTSTENTFWQEGVILSYRIRIKILFQKAGPWIRFVLFNNILYFTSGDLFVETLTVWLLVCTPLSCLGPGSTADMNIGKTFLI